MCSFISEAYIFGCSLATFFFTLLLSQIISKGKNLDTKLRENVHARFDHRRAHSCQAQYEVNNVYFQHHSLPENCFVPSPPCYFLTSQDASVSCVIIVSSYLLHKMCLRWIPLIKAMFSTQIVYFFSPHSPETHLPFSRYFRG